MNVDFPSPARLLFIRRVFFPLKNFLAERTWWFYVTLVVLAVTGVGFLYLGFFLVDLIWEPEMASLISRRALAIFLFLPAWLVVFMLAVLGKVFLDWVTRREGTRIRSRLVSYFLVVTLIPSLVLIVAFDRLLNASVEVFFRETVIEAMDNSLAILKNNVQRTQQGLGRLLTTLVDAGNAVSPDSPSFDAEGLARALGGSEADLFCVYEGGKRLFVWSRRGEPSHLRGLLNQMAWGRVSWDRGAWQTYRINEDVVLSARKLEGERVFVAAALPAGDLSPRVAATVDAIRRFKQFQILREPIKGSLLFLYFYFYVPILSLGLFFFFYKSNQITRPIGRMQLAAARIARGDFSQRIDMRIGDDEIQSLVNAFNRMARELLNNRLRLRHMSQMEAWRGVAVRLAHEIKNPLTPTGLALDQLEKEIQKDLDLYARTVEEFNIIRIELDHLRRLTSDFGSFSRETALQREGMRVRPFMLRFRETLDLLPGIRGELSVEHESDLTLFADEAKLRQVVLNLIQNAADSLAAMEGVQAPGIRVVSRTETGEAGLVWCLEVIDNGPGIKEEVRERLFQPYVTSKARGTGLGLVISQELVDAHGGRLFFDSVPGRTVFTVQIPVAAP
jgi:nitrogen fixation/metabolism regulation signal transduction histidine kinase